MNQSKKSREAARENAKKSKRPSSREKLPPLGTDTEVGLENRTPKGDFYPPHNPQNVT